MNNYVWAASSSYEKCFGIPPLLTVCATAHSGAEAEVVSPVNRLLELGARAARLVIAPEISLFAHFKHLGVHDNGIGALISQLGKLRGGDKKIARLKNRSKWVKQCPYIVMLAVPQ